VEPNNQQPQEERAGGAAFGVVVIIILLIIGGIYLVKENIKKIKTEQELKAQQDRIQIEQNKIIDTQTTSQ
jgi:uncharacterized membrane protein YciS (DUF1049 family)